MFKKYLIPFLSLLPTFLLAGAPIAFAQTSTCTSGSGVICNPLANATICSLITGILNAFMIIGAPIAVVFVIIAGAKFVLAMGKPDAIGKARDNLMWTLIGIAIFFGAIVITRVIFNTVSAFLATSSSTLTCTI